MANLGYRAREEARIVVDQAIVDRCPGHLAADDLKSRILRLIRAETDVNTILLYGEYLTAIEPLCLPRHEWTGWEDLIEACGRDTT